MKTIDDLMRALNDAMYAAAKDGMPAQKIYAAMAASTLAAETITCHQQATMIAQSTPCIWMHDDDMDIWYTECGDAHEFTHGGPKENKYAACPYCGRRLQHEKQPQGGDGGGILEQANAVLSGNGERETRHE